MYVRTNLVHSVCSLMSTSNRIDYMCTSTYVQILASKRKIQNIAGILFRLSNLKFLVIFVIFFMFMIYAWFPCLLNPNSSNIVWFIRHKLVWVNVNVWKLVENRNYACLNFCYYMFYQVIRNEMIRRKKIAIQWLHNRR